MKIDLSNRKILITGGTRGIGCAMAKLFSQSGGQVTITGTTNDSFKKFQQNNLNTELDFLKINFLNSIEMNEFLGIVESKKFDILVNCAGINALNSFENIPSQEWDNIQSINVRAPFLISQAVAKNMSTNGWGRIINVASIFGVVTKEKRLSYTTSKSALIGMTKTMAVDLASKNILVNALSPGFIDTELTMSILGESGIKEMVSKVPLGKLGDPLSVAKLALFLASNENTFITGQNIIIDGGFTSV
ncbi:MAG: SDR family NAD(P)-dependent oxidoreductase [Bacteriovoracaceae bacterium]|nr:SDR family NAD(P)-dependent oxidoreductase [Bacteriovoracaceae bacterium]